MPITFAVLYEGNTARSLVAVSEAPKSGDSFVWVDVSDPTKAELEALGANFRLHPLAIEDALTPQLPKAEPVGSDLFVVTRTARKTERNIEFGQVAIFVGPRHIVSVSRDGAPDHAELRISLENVPEMLEVGVDYILHGLLSFAANGFIELLDTFDDEVNSLEEAIPEGALDQSRIARLLTLRRHVKQLERTLQPMDETARKLATGELPCIKPDLTIYFRDIVDQVQRALAICAGVRDGLASVFEYSSLIEQQRSLVEQQRTGNVTRQLAAWAAILAVPTAIAGIYGMNFQLMPELQWRYGYASCVAVMSLLCVLLFWRFRRMGWL